MAYLNIIIGIKNSQQNNIENDVTIAKESHISLRANNYDTTTSLTKATVYESGNKMVEKNDCLTSNELSNIKKPSVPSTITTTSSITTTTTTNAVPTITSNDKKTLKKHFSIYDQPHRKRYLKKQSSNKDNKVNDPNDNKSSSTTNHNMYQTSPMAYNKEKHKKRYNHFIPVSLDDIITDVKEKTINVVMDGKALFNSNSNGSRKLTSGDKNEEFNSNSSLSNSSSLISTITPSSSSPTTFTTTSTVTTSIIKKGKNRVHHHLLYSREPANSDSFYEDNGREADYYSSLTTNRSSSFYDPEKNMSDNGFQTPNTSPTNPLKKLNTK